MADNAKNQFDKFIQAASFEHKESFLKFNFTEDRPDTFLGLYLANESQFKDLWHICKIIFILSQGQSSVERGFSVYKKVLQDNIQETSLISQRLVYDTLQSNNTKSQEFITTNDLRKSCMLSYHKYKLKLQKAAEKKTESTGEFELKQKFDEIENIKEQKLTLQNMIDSLLEGFEKETLEVDKNQDRGSISKAASFLRTIKVKENADRTN